MIRLISFAMLVSLATATAPMRCGAAPAQAPSSLQHEIQRAIDRGLAWLKTNQNSNGSWSNEDQPALTALALLAFQGDPSPSSTSEPSHVAKAYSYLESCVQPDGSIFKKKQLLTHNTALSLLALNARKTQRSEQAISKGRQFLIGLQNDTGEPGKADTIFDGGVGYGSKYEHSDMANTLSALEALYHTRQAKGDSPTTRQTDLDWKAAIHFLQNCQNLSSANKQPWVSEEAGNRGGFVYYPGHSMAGETNLNGRVALRSYGSASYAGLLSYIYADLKADDPRVAAVSDWLKANFTLEENPGMGPQGLYYYYHTMAKALTAIGTDKLVTNSGKAFEWRGELALRLMNLQKRDGSWVNDNARWWENDPVLVTSYAILTLEMIHRGLK